MVSQQAGFCGIAPEGACTTLYEKRCSEGETTFVSLSLEGLADMMAVHFMATGHGIRDIIKSLNVGSVE